VISVVIPVRNAAHVLPGQLRALAGQDVDEPWEVLIADNGSTDDLADVVADWKDRLPGLRIVDASGRRGAGHARNVGVRAALGDRILFCDADDEVAAGWVSAMGGALRSRPVVGGIQDHRRLSPPRNIRPGEGVTNALMLSPGFLPYVVGSNCGFRAEVLADVGGFDEDFLVAEDAEISYRVQAHGHELTLVPEAVVYYRERATLWGIAKQHYAWGRQDPRLYRRYASVGMPRRTWRAALRNWAHLIGRAPHYMRSQAERAAWVRSTAFRVGRIAGSIAYRTLYI
jgi:glycosyltransferase involved in cell wall biosynthesis